MNTHNAPDAELNIKKFLIQFEQDAKNQIKSHLIEVLSSGRSATNDIGFKVLQEQDFLLSNGLPAEKLIGAFYRLSKTIDEQDSVSNQLSEPVEQIWQCYYMSAISRKQNEFYYKKDSSDISLSELLGQE